MDDLRKQYDEILAELTAAGKLTEQEKRRAYGTMGLVLLGNQLRTVATEILTRVD